MIYNLELNYLKIFWLERRGGVGQESVNWRAELSSKIMGKRVNSRVKLLQNNLVFRDFCWRHFPTFSVRGDKLKYVGILILNLSEFHTCKRFFLSLSIFLFSFYFLTSENAVSVRLCHLKVCDL